MSTITPRMRAELTRYETRGRLGYIYRLTPEERHLIRTQLKDGCSVAAACRVLGVGRVVVMKIREWTEEEVQERRAMRGLSKQEGWEKYCE